MTRSKQDSLNEKLMWASSWDNTRTVDLSTRGGWHSVSQCLELGADPNYEHGGYTPLITSANRNCFENVEILLKAGANIEKISHDGLSPLCNMIRYWRHDKNQYLMVKLLLDHGADPNHVSDGRYNALHYAVYENYEEIIPLLLKFGADKNIKNIWNETAIEMAKKSYGNKEKLLKMLKK